MQTHPKAHTKTWLHVLVNMFLPFLPPSCSLNVGQGRGVGGLGAGRNQCTSSSANKSPDNTSHRDTLLFPGSFASPATTALLAKWLRRPPRERKIRGSNPACDGIFPSRVTLVTQKLALQWLLCQVPGVIGSVLGLVSPVSVYCDWVR